MADYEQLKAEDLWEQTETEPVYVITPRGAFAYPYFVEHVRHLIATEQYDELRALGCELPEDGD